MRGDVKRKGERYALIRPLLVRPVHGENEQTWQCKIGKTIIGAIKRPRRNACVWVREGTGDGGRETRGDGVPPEVSLVSHPLAQFVDLCFDAHVITPFYQC